MVNFTKDNYETYTMLDKAKRDEMYREFRTNGDENERRAVKYSSMENGVSTWTVAYPKD